MNPADRFLNAQDKVYDADRRLKESKIKLLDETNRFLEMKNLADQIAALKKKHDEAVALNKEYEKLLSKPLEEIATHKLGKAFKTKYMENQTLITNWAVSQKSFMEIAIQYGKRLGKTLEETIFEAQELKVRVIENQTDPEHGTGVDNLADFPEIKAAVLEHAEITLRNARERLAESNEKRRIEEEMRARELIDPVFKEERRREAAEKAAAEKAATEKAAAENAAAQKAKEEEEKENARIRAAERARHAEREREREIAREKAEDEKYAKEAAALAKIESSRKNKKRFSLIFNLLLFAIGTYIASPILFPLIKHYWNS